MDLEQFHKNWHKLSPTAQMHIADKYFGEQVNPPFYPELNAQLEQWFTKLDQQENKETVETGPVSHLKQVLKLVDQAQLNSEFTNDPQEIKKLTNCQENFHKQIQTILGSIEEYMVTIMELKEAAKKDNYDEIVKKDQQRRLKHNKLINEIATANRSLLWWFGEFNPDNISNPETEKMYERQKDKFICDHLIRQKIPINGICTDHLNLEDRDQINLWAREVFQKVASLH